MADTIPVIDFSNPNHKEVATLLVEAMEASGFVYLDGLATYDSVFEHSVLEALKWFFALPLEQKRKCSPKKWNPGTANVFRGYYSSILPDVKEFFLFHHMSPEDPLAKSGIPFYEPNVWPLDEGDVARCHYDVLHTFEEIVENAGIEAARLIAPEMGLPENDFAAKFLPKSTSDLKLMHYLEPDETTPDVTLEAHIDSGYITLFPSLGYRGLQLYLDDTWVDLEPRPGLIGLNMGDAMVKLSGGRFKATRHRVVNIGTERFTVPYFLNPSYDSTFDMMQDGKLVTMKFGPMYQNSLRNFPTFSHIPPA